MRSFRECYGVPDDIVMELALVEADRDGHDDQVLRISIMSIVKGGVRLPLYHMFCENLNTYRLGPF